MSGIIGIDASRAVRERKSGTENYSLQIITALRETSGAQLRLYYPASASAEELPPPSSATEHVPVAGDRLWTHRHLSLELRRNPPGVLFVPAHVIPIRHPRSVVTIHDLGYLHCLEGHPRRQRTMLALTTRWNVHRARHIIVPSQFTAGDVARNFPGAAEKITVIHHGVSSRYRPSSTDEIASTRTRLGILGDYVVAVGTIQPRKDYPTLARAVGDYNEQHPAAPLTLVIAGRPGWMVNQVYEQLEPVRQKARLKVITDASDQDIADLYSGAMAMVQPTRFEGFGMPVLEALACGAPVLYACNSSLPEVAGNAGIAFPTGDAGALAAALERVIANQHLRARLSAEGQQRAAQFTWAIAAEKTVSVLDQVMSGA